MTAPERRTIGRLLVPRIALILSSGRTGTRFLAEYFEANFEGVVARHEPEPARSMRLVSHAQMAGSLPRGALVRLLRRKRRRYIDPIQAELYVESNPFLSGFIRVLGDVFEEPTVIHVVRDPRDQVRSSLNHGTGSGLKGLANRFVPYWYPNAPKLLQLQDVSGWFGRAAGLWTLVNRELKLGGAGYPNYHLFRFEDVFDATSSGLRAICGALGLDYRDSKQRLDPSTRINRGRLDRLPPWREWSPEQCAELCRICSPLMSEYGYGNEPEWLERVAGRG